MTTIPSVDEMQLHATTIFTSLLMKGHTIASTVIAFQPDGSPLRLVTPFDGWESWRLGRHLKAAFLRKNLRKQLRKHGAVAFVVGSEVWAVANPPRWRDRSVETIEEKRWHQWECRRHGTARPRNSGRTNAVLVTDITHARVMASLFEIVRDARGRCDGLNLMDVQAYGAWTGQLPNLMEKPRTYFDHGYWWQPLMDLLPD